MERVEGKGLGMVASREMKLGETVVTEVAVLKLGGDEVGDEASSLGAQFALLSPALQRKVTALHSQGEEEGRDRLATIFQTNCIQADSGRCAGLFPTIARINHSCRPNVVWGQRGKNPMAKEVRVTRRIAAGEEICSNYLDDGPTNYSVASHRKAALEKWGFSCSCPSCSLPPKKQEEDDRLRRECGEQHQLVSSLVAQQDLPGALGAARAKLKLLLRLGDGLTADLPSAYMEVFEFLAISKAMGRKEEEPEIYREKAEELAGRLGDKFLEGYRRKYREIMYGTEGAE